MSRTPDQVEEASSQFELKRQQFRGYFDAIKVNRIRESEVIHGLQKNALDRLVVDTDEINQHTLLQVVSHITQNREKEGYLVLDSCIRWLAYLDATYNMNRLPSAWRAGLRNISPEFVRDILETTGNLKDSILSNVNKIDVKYWSIFPVGIVSLLDMTKLTASLLIIQESNHRKEETQTNILVGLMTEHLRLSTVLRFILTEHRRLVEMEPLLPPENGDNGSVVAQEDGVGVIADGTNNTHPDPELEEDQSEESAAVIGLEQKSWHQWQIMEIVITLLFILSIICFYFTINTLKRVSNIKVYTRNFAL
jgi:hypothetical protein